MATRTLTGFLPEGMPRYTRALFVFLGLFLTAVGLISLVNTVGVLRTNGFVPLLSVVYVVLNFSLAYGFFTGKRWVIPVLGANWLGNFFISSLYVHLSQTNPAISAGKNVFIITIAAIFFFTAFFMRKYLQGFYFKVLVSIPLFFLWLVAFLFNFLFLLKSIPALKGII